MKHELLVPVGDYESFIAAINAGADAVYLAGKKFGARSFAKNFEIDEIIEAIKTAHIYGVKVFVTVNTLIYDDEIRDVLDFIEILHQNNVDAVIMQDIGLINLVHKTFPNLEIHASTQMHVHNESTVKALEELGVKRVVFARELPLNYIENIETSLQKEVFIHGALCVSFSGQCLFSSRVLNRSGNRGECAGMCRLPYTLMRDNECIESEGKYLLSPKELCTLDVFEELLKSNIYSFKIEGRMKSPMYVSVVTKLYRKLIDDYEENKSLEINEEDRKLLTAIYNREFTKGFLFNDKNIMNIMSPNHQGLKVGTVLEVTSKKIKIKLLEDLSQFDGVRFKNLHEGFRINFLYDCNGKLVSKASKGDIIYLDNFMNLKELDELYLTSPNISVADTITKKIPITLRIKAKIGKELEVLLSDGVHTVSETSKVVEEAKKSPTSKDRIITQLSKFGNTPYQVTNVVTELDENIFINIKELNELRRMLTEELTNKRLTRELPFIKNNYEIKENKKESKINLSVKVRTKEQLACARDLGIKHIFVTDESLLSDDTCYNPPRDLFEYDFNRNQDYLLGDLGGIYTYPSNYGDYYLNVVNKYSLDYLSRYTKLITVSPELKVDQIISLTKFNNNFEVLVYGRVELMLLKYCVIGDCKNCKNHYYALKDRNDELFYILPTKCHGNIILDYKPLNLLNEIEELKNNGVNNFRVEFFKEGYEEMKQIIERVLN